jgi:hypothetical protein
VANTVALDFDEDDLAGLDTDGDDADHGAVLILHELDREPLVEKHRVSFLMLFW